MRRRNMRETRRCQNGEKPWQRIWYRIEHRLHWLRHKQAHRERCTCLGTGRYR